jgi:hypothetical protein
MNRAADYRIDEISYTSVASSIHLDKLLLRITHELTMILEHLMFKFSFFLTVFGQETDDAAAVERASFSVHTSVFL